MSRWLKGVAARVIDAASWSRVGLLLAPYGACVYVLGAADTRIKALSGGLGVPDLELGFTADELYARLGAYSDEGRAIYLRAELVDLVYALAYGFFFAFLIGLAARRLFHADSPWRLLCLAPLATMSCDHLENLGFFAVLLRWPARSDLAAHLAAVANLGKWSFCAVTVPAAVIGLLALAFVTLRGKRSATT